MIQYCTRWYLYEKFESHNEVLKQNKNNTDLQNLKQFTAGRRNYSVTMWQPKVVLEKDVYTVCGSDFFFFSYILKTKITECDLLTYENE